MVQLKVEDDLFCRTKILEERKEEMRNTKKKCDV